MRARYIHSRLSCREIPDLLQTIFVAELLAPSQCLWLVSPWVTDIPVIDNQTNGFICLEPSWASGRIRLTQVLAVLAGLGTRIHVAVRPSAINRPFLAALERVASPGIEVHEQDDLHEKGLLGDSFYLAGSMNFTFHGITLNEEAVHYTTDPEVTSKHHVVFGERWGGRA